MTACARVLEALCGERGKKEFKDDVALPDTVRGVKVLTPGACSSGLRGGEREAGERYRGECSLSGEVTDGMGLPVVLCRNA